LNADRRRQLAWFIGLYVAGVVAVAALGFGVRLIMTLG
jgi:hypothetical protein